MDTNNSIFIDGYSASLVSKCFALRFSFDILECLRLPIFSYVAAEKETDQLTTCKLYI